jgi:hypothetical protein
MVMHKKKRTNKSKKGIFWAVTLGSTLLFIESTTIHPLYLWVITMVKPSKRQGKQEEFGVLGRQAGVATG